MADAERCAWCAAGIEDLREKREEVHRQLMEEESERQKLTSELQLIQRRLNQINESISRKASVVFVLTVRSGFQRIPMF